ncbi:hypothetical protein VTP01DRAFT_2726 [Rhizomucor pusillus]|uniref:uncharacterized protein n=1 Tax=Rhizomucor pusillus TaxID=4840 RepID=UPI0037429C12
MSWFSMPFILGPWRHSRRQSNSSSSSSHKRTSRKGSTVSTFASSNNSTSIAEHREEVITSPAMPKPRMAVDLQRLETFAQWDYPPP